MTTKQRQFVKDVKKRKLDLAQQVVTRSRAIRKKLATTGAWDAVEVLRKIRYAK